MDQSLASEADAEAFHKSQIQCDAFPHDGDQGRSQDDGYAGADTSTSPCRGCMDMSLDEARRHVSEADAEAFHRAQIQFVSFEHDGDQGRTQDCLFECACIRNSFAGCGDGKFVLALS